MTVWVFAMTVWCASSRVSRSLANVAICSSPFTLAISPHRSSRNFGTHLLPLSLFPIFMLFTKSFIPALYSCLFQLYFPVAAQDDSFSNQSGLRAPSLVCNIVFYRYLAPVCRQAGLRGNPFNLLKVQLFSPPTSMPKAMPHPAISRPSIPTPFRPAKYRPTPSLCPLPCGQ